MWAWSGSSRTRINASRTFSTSPKDNPEPLCAVHWAHLDSRVRKRHRWLCIVPGALHRSSRNASDLSVLDPLRESQNKKDNSADRLLLPVHTANTRRSTVGSFRVSQDTRRTAIVALPGRRQNQTHGRHTCCSVSTPSSAEGRVSFEHLLQRHT